MQFQGKNRNSTNLPLPPVFDNCGPPQSNFSQHNTGQKHLKLTNVAAKYIIEMNVSFTNAQCYVESRTLFIESFVISQIGLLGLLVFQDGERDVRCDRVERPTVLHRPHVFQRCRGLKDQPVQDDEAVCG